MNRIFSLFILLILQNVMASQNSANSVNLKNFQGATFSYYLLDSEDKLPLVINLMNETYPDAPLHWPLKKHVAFQKSEITDEVLVSFFKKAVEWGKNYLETLKFQPHLLWMVFQGDEFIGFISVQRGFEKLMAKNLELPAYLFARKIIRVNLTPFVRNSNNSQKYLAEIMLDLKSRLLNTKRVSKCLFVYNKWDQLSAAVAGVTGFWTPWENKDYVLCENL